MFWVNVCIFEQMRHLRIVVLKMYLQRKDKHVTPTINPGICFISYPETSVDFCLNVKESW